MLVCIFPFYYIFVYSLSDAKEMARGGIILAPRGITLQNYFEVFKLPGIYNAFIVSLLRMVIGTIVTIFCSSLFAYVLTKQELYLRSTMYRVTIITLYLSAGLIPYYLTMIELGLKNNFLLYILPSAVVAYFIILIKTFIEQLPIALEESAMIDGAGYFTIYNKIIFPLSLPILATCAVFASVGQWNTWTDNFFLVNSPFLRTITLVLYDYLNDAARLAAQAQNRMGNIEGAYVISTKTIQVTITMVVTIPILMIYPFLQKYFVKGILLGAVKG